MVPGSHRHFRQPTTFENKLAGNERNPHVIPIEVPAGTAIVWHGNTWHGSFPRKMPGLRVNLSMYFCRQYMAPQELYADRVPDDLLKRHGRNSRMAQLLGLNHFNGWRDEGPQMQRSAHHAGRTQLAVLTAGRRRQIAGAADRLASRWQRSSLDRRGSAEGKPLDDDLEEFHPLSSRTSRLLAFATPCAAADAAPPAREPVVLNWPFEHQRFHRRSSDMERPMAATHTLRVRLRFSAEQRIRPYTCFHRRCSEPGAPWRFHERTQLRPSMNATSHVKCGGVIIAGGRATRMGGVGKPFLKLNGRTIIERLVERAKAPSRRCGRSRVPGWR